jgi:hypothetical protein
MPTLIPTLYAHLYLLFTHICTMSYAYVYIPQHTLLFLVYMPGRVRHESEYISFTDQYADQPPTSLHVNSEPIATNPIPLGEEPLSGILAKTCFCPEIVYVAIYRVFLNMARGEYLCSTNAWKSPERRICSRSAQKFPSVDFVRPQSLGRGRLLLIATNNSFTTERALLWQYF